MKLYRGIAVLLVAALWAALACKTIDSRKALKDCKYDLLSVDVKDFSLSEAKLVANISVTNPNDIEVIFDRFNYELWCDKNLIATGWHTQQEKINAGGAKVLSLPVNVPLKNLGKGLLTQIRNPKNTVYTLKGTVYIKTFIGELSVPVKMTKTY